MGVALKLFIMGCPHTITRADFNHCGFTMITRHLCKMMKNAGHEVIHLGVEGSDPDCTETVAVVRANEWKQFYGQTEITKIDASLSKRVMPYHQLWAARARAAILERCSKPNEAIVCLTFGNETQLEAAKGLEQYVCEATIGYQGASSPYRIYASHACLNIDLGNKNRWLNPDHERWAVIQCPFDPDMFEYREQRGDYFFFVGRLNDDKGVAIAIKAAAAAGRRIIVAGTGDYARFKSISPLAEFIGPVNIEQRKQYLSECKAVFAPSQYAEPFCNVPIEANMSGAPCIGSDFGGLVENILPGITGFRCRTQADYDGAARRINEINPAACRKWAMENFSLERVGRMYDTYFKRVMDPSMDTGNWVERRYP